MFLSGYRSDVIQDHFGDGKGVGIRTHYSGENVPLGRGGAIKAGFTNVPFCDVLIQRDPELGIRVVLPSRRGESTLSFNLHNRHTYSQSEEQEGRAYTQYLATVSMASMEGEIIGHGVVLSEFREAVDLVARVLGDVEGSGFKAVAPTGVETVSLAVPEDLDELVIVGQSLEVMRVDGRDVVSALGRPVAVISNATIEYRPR